MAAGERLRIGVIMGSDSDRGTMREVDRALIDAWLEPTIDFEDGVVSAHRTPKAMSEYAEKAEERGLQVIIAGAGGSAHLPGMVASETRLPVLGVAVTSSPDIMNPALGSLIRMPEGKPLATFQAGKGAYAAGVLASRIVRLESDMTRVGIIASPEERQGAMSKVGSALAKFGLAEGTHYDYVTERDIDLTRTSSDWAKDGGFGVIVGTSNGLRGNERDLADRTQVPVIGVALPPEKADLDKMSDQLDMLVNERAGKSPIAAMEGPAGAFNAGLEAVRILALRDPWLRPKIDTYNENLATTNYAKNSVMNRIGGPSYDELMKNDSDELQRLIDAEMNKDQ